MSRGSGEGYLTGRQLSREHMDDPQATAHDVDEALQFIRIVNRRLGGTGAALRQFKRWARTWPISSDRSIPHPAATSPEERVINILDIGTGSADIPLAIAEWAESNGHRVMITAVDLHPVTLELAKQHVGERTDIQLIQADALRLMDRFAPRSFNYVHAGMFLHHLDDVQALTVLTIMDRLATRGMIWNDLLRGWIGRVGVRLATLRAPALVRHDAVVSVEAGFTRVESLALTERAGWRKLQFRRHLFHRFTVISEKPIGL